MKNKAKRLVFCVALVCLAILGACGPAVVKQPLTPKTEDASDVLFSQAEKLLRDGKYERALSRYTEYMRLYPESALIPDALMRSAKIYATLEMWSEAGRVSAQLVREYPEHFFAPDARIQILEAFYEQGRYDEVIRHAEEIMQTTASNNHIARAYIILSDAYIHFESPVNAAYCLILAHDRYTDGKKEAVLNKVISLFEQLDVSDLVFLLSHTENATMEGHLILRLTDMQADQGDYKAAIETLSLFVAKYPDHEKAGASRDLIQELKLALANRVPAVGCLLPVTGRYKSYGLRALNGIEMALESYYTRSPQTKLRLIVKDTRSNPQDARRAVRELGEEKVLAIIGPIDYAEAAASEAQAQGTPIITMTQKDDITEQGDYVFRNFLTPRMQVKTLVNYSINQLGLRNYAILYPHEKYGQTFMNLLWDELLLKGGRVVGVESYDPAATDFAVPIKKLVGLYYSVPDHLISPRETANAEWDPEFELAMLSDTEKKPYAIVDFDAIFIPDEFQKVGLIMPQLAFYDVKDVLLMGTNLWHLDRLIEMARKYVQGAIITDGFFASSPAEWVQEFVSAFESVYKTRPGFIEAIAYDTALMLFELIDRGQIVSANELRNELTKMHKFNGVTGSTSFTENGEAVKDTYLLQIKDKRVRQINLN